MLTLLEVLEVLVLVLVLLLGLGDVLPATLVDVLGVEVGVVGVGIDNAEDLFFGVDGVDGDRGDGDGQEKTEGTEGKEEVDFWEGGGNEEKESGGGGLLLVVVGGECGGKAKAEAEA